MLINLNYLISMYLFYMSIMMFCLFFKHLMLLIISLEFILMMLLFNLYLILMFIEVNMFVMLLMLIFFVCEGALSLSLIVLIVRFNGNDYINSLSMIKW